MLLAGSPCDPFSTQRSKRYQQGSVMEHDLCGVTMNVVTALFSKFEPDVGLLEQVTGFEKPIEANSQETPYDRRDF